MTDLTGRTVLIAGATSASGLAAARTLPAGTIITASTAVYDLPNERILAADAGQPLVISAGAVVVPGARAVTSGAGRAWG